MYHEHQANINASNLEHTTDIYDPFISLMLPTIPVVPNIGHLYIKFVKILTQEGWWPIKMHGILGGFVIFKTC